MIKKLKKRNRKNNTSKKINYLNKMIPGLSVTLYLSIYSIYYLDVSIFEKYINLSHDILRIVSILTAYILSGYISTKNIKDHKNIKLTYMINFIVFIIILVI
ncbi:hypothetical protein [Tepidibacter sp.]|jgi:hypothetical protein|uniref:hypothetical protein n=1 Tax=Tepidibacter sp. TaxID=2529387 RepID=UPI0025DA71F1|nr:hypothetical protein [Tepidibacter sp.]